MVATLETIFRRPIYFLLLIVLLPLLSAVVIYLLPRSYEADASLWAEQRYIVIGATGPETDLQATPAQTQTAALTELLQSRAFALTVADETDLPSTLSASVRADRQKREDALYQEISTKVVVTPSGYNLFTVAYTNTNPKIAQEVIETTIQNFARQSQAFTAVEAQQLLASYQTQLTQAQQQEKTDAQAEEQYLLNNPQLTLQQLQVDPQYQMLHAQTQHDQATEQNIQDQITTINLEIAQQGKGSDYLFKVLDAPAQSVQAVSRLKTYLLGGGLGLGIALLAYALYIVLSIRRHQVAYTARDLEKVAPFPLVMELPQFSPAARSLLALPEPAETTQEETMAVGKRS
ncbi:MAG TPA: hypothetical protein VFV38_49455 [Ktedonobacteraceae bacterium]|nr:hypothetical protein [Ktedonobacteraceae bacterium]